MSWLSETSEITIVDDVVNEIYKKYNKKHDGLMTKAEAMQFVADHYGNQYQDMSCESQNECFSIFDQNKSGYIERSEFARYVKNVVFEG